MSCLSGSLGCVSGPTSSTAPPLVLAVAAEDGDVERVARAPFFGILLPFRKEGAPDAAHHIPKNPVNSIGWTEQAPADPHAAHWRPPILADQGAQQAERHVDQQSGIRPRDVPRDGACDHLRGRAG